MRKNRERKATDKQLTNSWTSFEQYSFLMKHYPEYKQIHDSPKPKYGIFWAQAKEAWFKAFPEIKTLFPAVTSEKDLDLDQCTQLSNAIEKRIAQIKTWFRWKASQEIHVGGRQGRRRQASPAPKPRAATRALKPVEMYSKSDKKRYRAKIRPRAKQLAKEMLKVNGGTMPRGGYLVCARQAANEAYAAESDEVKMQIADMIVEEARVKRENEEILENTARTPKQYLHAIESVKESLGDALELLAKRTGWSFSVLMGGPQPNANGKISVASFHVGNTPVESNFSTTKNFIKNCMDPYTIFLEDTYSEADREAATIILSGDGNDNVDESDISDESDTSDDEDEDNEEDIKEQLKGAVHAIRSVSPQLPSSIFKPEHDAEKAQTTATPNIADGMCVDESIGRSSATPLTDLPVEYVHGGGRIPGSGGHDFSMNRIERGHFTSSFQQDEPNVTGGMGVNGSVEHIGLANNQYGVYGQGGRIPGSGNQSSMMNPTEGGRLASNTEEAELHMGQANDHAANYNGYKMNAPSSYSSSYSGRVANGDMHAANSNFSLNALAGPWNFDHVINSFSQSSHIPNEHNAKMYAPVNVLDSHLFNGTDGFHDNHSSQGYVPPTQFILPEANPDNAALVQPNNSSLANNSTLADNPSLQHTPLTGILADPSSLPNGPILSLSVSGPLASRLANKRPVLQEVTESQNVDENITKDAPERRASGRQSKPSKRNDLLNKIGENAKPHAPVPGTLGKENIPPSEPPSWALLAEAHFLVRDLGEDWKECVKVWFGLERKSGFSEAKSALPGKVFRPEEWMKWAAKTRNGARPYDSIPYIEHSAEFGNAVMKWWYEMQPEFRKQGGELPAPLYVADDDSLWDPLRKSGPNGLITVMTMVAWWGRSTLDRTEYQVDSSNQWHAIVIDITKCLHAIYETTTVGAKKRKLPIDKESISKRYVNILPVFLYSADVSRNDSPRL